MSNVWGSNIKLSIFGESHGPAIGMTLGGLPPGLEIDWAFVSGEMARRAPGSNALSTPRKEDDAYEVLSGVFESRTTGAPLSIIIRNGDTRSADYAPHLLRPGHADWTAHIKYKGFADYRGGGHFSGRLTAPLVFAGAIAKQLLARAGIEIGARIVSVYDVEDCTPGCVKDIVAASRKPFPVCDDAAAERMRAAIAAAKAEGDSVGGVVQCVALGVPIGCGEPFFDSIESAVASMLFSIPAVKGVQFGDGFALAGMKGSAANDQFTTDGKAIRTTTNRNGGINGGITNGMPLIVSVAIKPTPTIHLEQSTVDINTMENVTARFGGRHDPCIVARAAPVVEAGVAIVLLDFLVNELGG